MDADRELDARIAKEVYGLDPILVEDEMTVHTVDRRWLRPGDYYYLDGGRVEVPCFSEDTAVALQMIEMFTEQHGATFLIGTQHSMLRRNGKYLCEIRSGDFAYTSPALKLTVFADTVARAIRSAVLQMLDIQKNVQDE